MENFKKPETMIGVINTAAILGSAIYFYKKINNLELELNKHSEHLTSTINKVSQIVGTKKSLTQIVGAIKNLNQAVGNDKKDVETLKQIVLFQSSQITELHSTITKLVEKLEEVDLPLNFTNHNPYLRSFYPQQQQYNQQPTQRQQLMTFSNQQQPSAQPRQPAQQFQQQPAQPRQPAQQFQQQPTQQFQQPAQQFQQQPTQQFQQQPAQQFQQQPAQQFQQQPAQQFQQPAQQFQQPAQQFQQSTQQFQNDPVDDIDEDAAIAAVKSARQQQNDPVDLLF